MSKKILVAYFSASGVTAKAAWKLSEAAGAEAEPHQSQFSSRSGPQWGRTGPHPSTPDFARRKFCFSLQVRVPRNRGLGKGDYGHASAHRSRPQRRFGDFAAEGKVTRRPQTAESPTERERHPFSSTPPW